MPYGYGGSSSSSSSSSGGGGPPGGGGRDPSTRGRDPSPPTPQPARHHAVDTPTQVQEQKVADELNRQNEMRDLIVQQQQEKDYIDIISKTTAPGTGTTSELQGQLKLDEYQEPNTFIDKAVGFGLNMLIPGAGYAYNAPFNPYKASNFFQGTGIQDLDENALLSGSVSPEDAAAYRAGTYGQPTTTGGDNQPTTGGDNQPIIGGGGPDVMPTTPSYVNPTGIASIPMDNQTTSGYNEQQDFVDNTYRQNLLDFFKGTGYTGLYG